MVAMQLNGIGGQFCTVDPRTQAPKPSNSTEENLPTLSKAFGCPLRSTGGMGPAVSSSLNVAVLPQPHAPPPAIVLAADTLPAVQRDQRRRRPLRAAHDLSALDHRLPHQRQHHPEKYPLRLGQPTRLPQPGDFYDIPRTRESFGKDKTNEVTTKALFVENRLGLTDKLSLLTGLRYDAIDLDVTNHRVVTATNPRHSKRNWEPVTGRVGLTYQFIPSANVYVQYSTAAEQPSTPTQVFDVSTGKQWEVGSKFDYLECRGSATMATYKISARTLP